LTIGGIPSTMRSDAASIDGGSGSCGGDWLAGRWLASAPEAARAELRRALEIDRALWTL
jgi:hypothetical protein